MDFYGYKLHLYAKDKPDLPIEERMFMAKKFAEEQAQKEYNDLKEGYMHAMTVNPALGHYGMEASGRLSTFIYQERMLEASGKIKTIQEQTPEEYFEELQEIETESLEEYADKRGSEYTEATCKLTRLNKNKGIFAKFTNFFGQAEQTRAEITAEMDLLNQQYSVAQESLESWTSMPQEDKTEYLLGRIEIDQLTSFDRKGMDELGRNLNLMAQEEATQTSVDDFTTDLTE